MIEDSWQPKPSTSYFILQSQVESIGRHVVRYTSLLVFPGHGTGYICNRCNGITFWSGFPFRVKHIDGCSLIPVLEQRDQILDKMNAILVNERLTLDNDKNERT